MNAWLGLSKWQLERQRNEQQVKELVETAKATRTENSQSTIPKCFNTAEPAQDVSTLDILIVPMSNTTCKITWATEDFRMRFHTDLPGWVALKEVAAVVVEGLNQGLEVEEASHPQTVLWW